GEGRVEHERWREREALAGTPEAGDEPLRGDRGAGREGEEGVMPPHLQSLEPDRLRAQTEADHIEETVRRLGHRPESIAQLAAHVLDLSLRPHPGPALVQAQALSR